MTEPPVLQHFRVTLGRAAIGPGKAALLAAIAHTGSIAAAGRSLGMSYKRAWSLMEDLNAGFAAPLVESNRGGSSGGGARLTTAGETVLQRYEAMRAKAEAAVREDAQAIRLLLAAADGEAK